MLGFVGVDVYEEPIRCAYDDLLASHFYQLF